MAGHSRPKDGVASARLCPAIHVFLAARLKTWMPGIADKFTQSAQKQTALAGHDGVLGSYFPVFTNSKISSVRRVSAVLIAYTSEIWLCCGSMNECAQAPARLQLACFRSSYYSTKRGGSGFAHVVISGGFLVPPA